MIEVGSGLFLDPRDLEEKFVRASGPGGQNVNKVSSAVELRFNLGANQTLPWAVRLRLARLAGRRLTKEGVLVLQANQYRTQDDNRRDAFERLSALIIAAAVPPPPPRRPTRVPLGQKRKRLDAKKARGAIKSGRKAPAED
jgi:ribosome-associated protein